MKTIFAVCVAASMVGCASSPTTAPSGQPSVTPVSFSEALQPVDESSKLEVCDTRIVRKRAELSSDCINIIDKAPTAGKRYHAVGLDVKEDPKSLCRNMYTPRCRKDF